MIKRKETVILLILTAISICSISCTSYSGSFFESVNDFDKMKVKYNLVDLLFVDNRDASKNTSNTIIDFSKKEDQAIPEVDLQERKLWLLSTLFYFRDISNDNYYIEVLLTQGIQKYKRMKAYKEEYTKVNLILKIYNKEDLTLIEETTGTAEATKTSIYADSDSIEKLFYNAFCQAFLTALEKSKISFNTTNS